jgi:two-component system cell cycle sensor histidine kinase/response regulator CckA
MRPETRPLEVLDEFPDPVVVVDRGGVVVYASNLAVECFGRPRERMVGEELAPLFEAAGKLALRRTLRDLSEAGTAARIEATLAGAGGAAATPGRRLELAVRRFQAQERVLFYVCARSPVAGVAEDPRTLERLWQTQKMEAVGRLAGGIAHEFNNLLTTIIGSSELLSYRLGDEPELRAELHGIRTATDRAATLVRRLLTFARRQAANPQVVDLRDVVRGADRILASAVGEEVELHINVAGEECTTRVDVSQMEQVLLNLVINARDAMPSGGEVHVGVERTRLPTGGDGAEEDYVRMTVTDTGSGMSREVLDRAFEPFFTTKQREYGSGLGLAIVYGVVRQNGGFITAESAIDEGSTFSICLPYVQAPLEADAPAAEPPAGQTVPRGVETILVVEDDELVRGITVRALRALGYRILLAEDGEDALKVVAKHNGRIDLVVTDVAMPRMGGLELAERLGRDNPGLKVLFVSGYAEDELPQPMVLADNHAFLDKPFTASMLARKLREMLDR